MSSEHELVKAAVVRFYDAIEDMTSGRGLDAMSAAWHHTDQVTAGHPSGNWSEGWDEIWETWKIFATFGRPERSGSKIEALRVYVYGDFAYSTCLFTASPAFGGEVMPCTDILHRVAGEWKLIHHHADKSPGVAAAAERFAAEG